MLDLLWRAVFRWRRRPHHVTGDGKYGTAENVAVLEKAGIRAYVALHESGSKPGFFAKSEFFYDPHEDAYVCPAGELLHRVGRSSRGVKYRARASVCEACSLRAQCTTSSQGRSVDRYPGDEYLEKVRLYAETEPYRKALRKRKVWVEPLFAEAKMWARDESVSVEDLAKGKCRSLADRRRAESQEAAHLRVPPPQEASPGGGPTLAVHR